MTDSSEIICKPTNWVKIRGVLILTMFGVFAFLFYKDGTTGYRDKNVKFFVHNLITSQAPEIAGSKEHNFDESSWRAFVEKQTVPFPDEVDGPIPEDLRDMKWPKELADDFSILKESDGPIKIWKEYTKERKWDEDVGEKAYDKSKIDTQVYLAYFCVGLFLVVLFFFLRILSRKMIATSKAYIAPGGQEVAYEEMKKIDKRNWDTKGIAYVYYEDGGKLKKVKVDGMIYGQFKKQDGEPAEKLFSKIIENFKGELIEYEVVEEDENESKIVA